MQLTNQEKINYIDRVINGLTSQGRLSYNKEIDLYMYRDPDGAKCAIGWLIPDDKYIPEIETTYISLSEEHHKLINLLENISIPVKDNMIFFQRLQSIHDDTHNFEWAIDSYKEYRKKFEEII